MLVDERLSWEKGLPSNLQACDVIFGFPFLFMSLCVMWKFGIPASEIEKCVVILKKKQGCVSKELRRGIGLDGRRSESIQHPPVTEGSSESLDPSSLAPSSGFPVAALAES